MIDNKNFKTPVVFVGGMVFGAIIAFSAVYEAPNKFDFMDHPREQQVSATCYLQDANMAEISITVKTKEDMHTLFMERDAKAFMCKVASQYSTGNWKDMALKFKEDTIKFLGLPCSAMFMNVNIGPKQ